MDPLDTHGDKLRRALHTETQTFVCDPYALDNIRARTYRRRWWRHGSLIVAALLLADALLLLFALGGS